MKETVYRLVKAARNKENPDTEILEEIRDIYGMDLYKEALNRITAEKPIKELWEAACSGDIETLKEYYENGGIKDRRMFLFNKWHSLIAGAYRNRQMHVVKYLYDIGETPEEHEKEEIKYFNFAIVIGRRNGTEDIIGFAEKENALTVFQALESVAAQDEEKIETLSFEINGIRTKEIHY